MSQIFHTLYRFLNELRETIPELKPAIDEHLSKSSLPKPDDVILGKFLESLAKYDEELASRDDSVFQECLILGDIFLGPYWKHLSESTKDTIWKYLSLLVLGGGKYFAKKAGAGGKEKNERISSGLDGHISEKVIQEVLMNKDFQEKILGNLKDLQKSMTDADASGGSGSSFDLSGAEDYIKKLFGDNTGSPMEILKTMTGISDIESTEIGKLFHTILGDLSGVINPDDFSFGMSQEELLKQKPEDLMGMILKKGFSSKILSTFGGLEKSVNERIKKGDLDPKKLLEQSQTMMANLIPKLGPGMGDLLAKMIDSKTGNHKATTRSRLQQKLEARRKQRTSGGTSEGTDAEAKLKESKGKKGRKGGK
jgi:hypothetical protein